ncbi:MAG: hypothetical protein P1V51_20620 [Deltaproteobacteria bacterium]|nr:hypothetical protein [Deltaproteobacteria bacterium]
MEIDWRRGRFLDASLEADFREARFVTDRRLLVTSLALLLLTTASGFYLDFAARVEVHQETFFRLALGLRLLSILIGVGAILVLQRARTPAALERVGLVAFLLFTLCFTGLATIYGRYTGDNRMVVFLGGLIVIVGCTMPSRLGPALLASSSLWAIGVAATLLGLTPLRVGHGMALAILTLALLVAAGFILYFHRNRRLDYLAVRCLNEERAKMRSKLEQVEQYVDLAQISAAIAHDLNNVLNIIMLAPGVLEARPDPPRDRPRRGDRLHDLPAGRRLKDQAPRSTRR